MDHSPIGYSTSQIALHWIIAALVVCLVCYTIYYHLGLRSGFVVGIIPLASGGVMMAVICISICRSPTR